MISRRRSAPNTAAKSIEPTTSANSTVTCLNSAWLSRAESGDPQASQNLAPAREAPAPQHVHTSPAAVTPALPVGPAKHKNTSRGEGVLTPALSGRASRLRPRSCLPIATLLAPHRPAG